jgi:hypothetical protein
MSAWMQLTLQFTVDCGICSTTATITKSGNSWKMPNAPYRFGVALLKKLTEKGTGNLLLSAKLRCCDLLAGRFARLAPWFCLDRSKTGDPAKSLDT